MTAPAPLALDAHTGRKMGKYEVVCRLSTGGMSEIYLAHHRGLAGFRKFVVLKQILDNIRGHEDYVRMFVQEAKITAAFTHSNIAQVYDLDVESGLFFLAMEFVAGVTLVDVAKACLGAGETIPLGFALAAVRDTALALHYAHTFTDVAGRAQPVVHRDVAEKNIMVTYEGVTKLLDFGIAKRLDRVSHTRVGTVKGTSGYMSPEQLRGEELDPRSDVFSLGVVLYECLTSQRLFHRKSKDEEMMAILKEEIAPPSHRHAAVPPALDEVVLRALERDRSRRYDSARDLARAIERAGGDLLWEQELCAGLVQRHFADRRAQTRTLLSMPPFAEPYSDVHGVPLVVGGLDDAPTHLERALARPAVAAAPAASRASGPRLPAAPRPPTRDELPTALELPTRSGWRARYEGALEAAKALPPRALIAAGAGLGLAVLLVLYALFHR